GVLRAAGAPPASRLELSNRLQGRENPGRTVSNRFRPVTHDRIGASGRRRLVKLILAAPGLALASRARADDDEGRLRLVAGFETGGPGDVLTRVLAIEFGRHWDEAVAVMNR